jgi:uncharacterized protein involved in exopolysaccharide biosynthesis
MQHDRQSIPGGGGFTALPPPHVEVVTHPGGPPDGPPRPWYLARRLQLFALVFLLVLIPGLVWDFLRPPQYRASASLLTAVPPPSAEAGGPAAEDVQHVAIQRQVLLGRDLLVETLGLVEERTTSDITSPERLGSMLDVATMPGTNLVELHALGSDPELLAIVVNAWIDGYLNLRQRLLEEEVGDRRRALEDELASLTERIETRRGELDAFRAENDIVTLERDGNEALASLSALTEDLNRARDESVEAAARAASMREAMARGDPVVPPSEEANLEQLEVRAAELRARLIELEKRFTPLYLENEPDLQVLPAQLAALETEIGQKRRKGGATVLALADQEVAQARRRVEVLEERLAEQKEKASAFTTGFARYESMQQELADLEEMQRTLQSRLAALDAKGLEKYPAVEVVEAAHPPAVPIAPAYWRDAGWVALAALAAGLIAVLLFEFLTRQPQGQARTAPVTGVRVFPGGGSAAAGLGAPGPSASALGNDQRPAIGEATRPTLPGAEGVRPRELIVAEVEALWSLADPMSRELIALLLSGLTLEECVPLGPEQFALDDGLVRIDGEQGREISLAGPVRDLFASCRPLPMWSSSGGSRLSADELAARIGLLAHDAGLAQPEEVTPEALRHTYVAYLVRQGARLTELERVIGPTAPSRLAAYRGLAPAGAAKSLADLDLLYPVLRAAAPA